jgi:hypothetical protein
MTGAAPGGRSPWRFALYLVLFLSLLANAVVLGLWLRLRGTAALGEGWRELPAPARAEFRARLAESRPEFARRLAELAEARRGVLEAAERRPFDRAAVEAAMARVRALTAALQADGQALLLGALERAAGEE